MESEDENVAAIKGSAMVYCTECGFANEQGNAFCSQCGSPLEQPEANPAAPASPEPPAGRPGVDQQSGGDCAHRADLCRGVGHRLEHGIVGSSAAGANIGTVDRADALDSADDGDGFFDAKSRPRRTRLIAPKTRTATIRQEKLDGEVEAFVIASSQLSDIADSYSSSDVPSPPWSSMEHPPTPQRTPPSRTSRPASNSWLRFLSAGLSCGPGQWR